MQLNEHLSKRLVERFGVPCNRGSIAKSEAEAVAGAKAIGYPVGIKAQLPASGRGKSGAILSAANPSEVRNALAKVLNAHIDGMTPDSVRVESWTQPDSEIFLALAFSAEHGGPVVMFSPNGGVEIEQGDPPTIVPVRPDLSLDAAKFLRATLDANLPRSTSRDLLSMAQALLRAYISTDATLIELNPVGIFGAEIMTLDARVIIDDNSLFRQEEVAGLVRASSPRPPEDIERDRSRLEYVPLNGAIGLVSGGAGMTLAAMDLIAESGEQPACFLDCSANPTRDGYARALTILADSSQVKATLISIFGGLTLVDKVAENLCGLLADGAYEKPVTFRLMGSNVEQAEAILASAGYSNHRTIEGAVEAVVKQAQAVRNVA